MSIRAVGGLIRLRGVRQNNLKNFDLDLPTGQFIVVTGLSGSGKSSLAFDTLYAEGQRRYIETFSPYARQFFERMDKPQVDSIQGIPPAIAIEQRNAVKSTRSTVGTMTEICDYMKVVWAHFSQLHCRQCGQPVRKDSPQTIWSSLVAPPQLAEGQGREVLVTFELPLSENLSLAESLALVAKQGYQRLLISAREGGITPEIIRLDEAVERFGGSKTGTLTVIQDRIRLEAKGRSRLVEACEQAYHFGKGKIAIYALDGAAPARFSNRLHCAACDLEYREPSPALFSFNHPVGACPTCRGFGRTIAIDYDLAIPDWSLSLADGAVKPWQTGQSAECQADLEKFCRRRKVPMDVPFGRMTAEQRHWVLEGDPGYGKDAAHEWPNAWYGVKGYFRWLESKSYKMHVRVLLSRYRAYRTCGDCQGRRFQPETLLFRCNAADGTKVDLAGFYQLTVDEALRFMDALVGPDLKTKAADPLRLVVGEVRSRLAYLEEVGLGYLTLDRPTRSLSGGETERVNLTTCLGSRLVNTLFVLDEPSVGLHPRDTRRLIGILERLRNSGNTVVVVEHDPSVMRAADHLVDLGPGHGAAGGELVFQGSYSQILKAKESLTGQYLRGVRTIQIPARRRVLVDRSGSKTPRKYAGPVVKVLGATQHNLKGITVEIPLERLVCITGVSGSGKTTLVREVLFPLLSAKLRTAGKVETGEEQEVESGDEGTEETRANGQGAGLSGWESLGHVVLVDQAPIGKTPRSNPAVYVGAFDHIRELFAQSEPARRRGLGSSAFSFNSGQGQCELCRGAGFEKIEMQFLSDVYIRCPACNGRRYREHILEVRLQAGTERDISNGRGNKAARKRIGLKGREHWSIADLLEATVDDSIKFLGSLGGSRPATRAIERLRLLQEVGLGYLRLGQPINTLSGGESQRLKLVSHLAEFASAGGTQGKTLFLFDEPTTGLHFDDVRVLLQAFQRLVEEGHSVVVIEHNLDLVKSADWLIDLGPEAGAAGGQIVTHGTPEEVAACSGSWTGQSLREAGVIPAS